MVTLGRTVCMSGIRRTDPGDTMVIPWIVESTATAGTAPERVDWEIHVNGLPPRTGSSTRKAITQPNFSNEPSRCPGVTAGQAPFECFSLALECHRFPGGTIVVTATASGHDGTTHTLQPVTFYNDSDGVDRRPSTKTIFLDGDDGSDLNDGSDWANSVRTANRAIYLAQANPGGASSADRDCHGAVIYARGTLTGGGGSLTSTPWHCSGEGWLHVICEPGTTWSRANAPWYTSGADDVTMYGNGPGTYARLRITGCDFVGAGPVGVIGPGVLGRVWVEGGRSGSGTFVNDGNVSCRWADDDNDVWSFQAASQADIDAGKVSFTGHLREGVRMGIQHYDLAYDCEAKGYLSNGFFVVGPQKKAWAVACHAHLQRYAQGPGQVEGWVRHIGGTGFEVQVLGGGIARILGPVGGYDFGRDASGMFGSPRWGVGCYGFPQAENSGTFPLVAWGVTGGRSYVDVQNPDAVAGTGAALTYLETTEFAGWGGSPYNIVIHTNGFSIAGDRTTDDGLVDCAVYDCTGAASEVFLNRPIDGSPGFQRRLLLYNLRGPCDGKQWLAFGSNVTDTLIRKCTFTGALLMSNSTPAPPLDFTGLEILNCTFGSVGAAAPEILALGATVDSCHWFTGSLGTNATSGAWFFGSPLVPPWSAAPASGREGTGTPLLQDTSEWAWSVAGSTRGCQTNTAEINWSRRGDSPATTVYYQAAGSGLELATVSPTAVLGPVTVSVAPSVVALTTVDPVVLLGSVAVEAEPCVMLLGSVDPVVVLGPVTATAEPCTLAVEISSPSAVLGAIKATAVFAMALSTAGPVAVLGEEPQQSEPTIPTGRPISSRKLWVRAPKRIPFRQ